MPTWRGWLGIQPQVGSATRDWQLALTAQILDQKSRSGIDEGGGHEPSRVSIEAESIDDAYGVPFQIFYGVSDNARTFWSINHARRVIGYQPMDDSEVVFAADIAATLARHADLFTGRSPVP